MCRRSRATDRHGRQRRQRLLVLPGLQQPVQIQRPARLRAGARQAHAAKRLHAHDSANHIAVHINIAHPHLLRDLGNRLVNAAVNAKRQAVAGGVDRVQHLAELLAAVAQHMQHRAEHLALQAADAVDLDQRGPHKIALGAAFVAPHPGDALACGLHRGNMLLDPGACLLVDDRADIGAQAAGMADDPFVHRQLDHLDHAPGAVFLQAQQAQRRAALTGRIKSRHQHVADQLLGQRRRVGHQRVLAAGLGDQWDRAALRAQAARQRLRNQPRDLGRAGEQHARHQRVRHQRGADGFARAGQQLQRVRRHARLDQDVDHHSGDQRRLLGGLG